MQQNYQEIYEMNLIRQNEKKTLKMAYLKTALTILIYIAVQFVFALPLRKFDKIFPPIVLENETLFSVIYYSIYLIITLVSVIIPAIILRKMDRKPMGLYPQVDSIEPKKALGYVLGGFFVSFVGNNVANIFMSLFSGFGIELSQPDFSLPQNPAGMFLYFIIITLGAGIGEEIMFRGAIMGHLRKFGDLSAIIVSAFLFGVIHGNLIQMPFAFILGLYLGYVAVKTRNIVYPMLIHAVNNGVATIVNYIADSLGETGEIIVGLVYTAMVVGLGVIGLIILIKNRKMDYPLREEQGIFPAGKKFGIMLSTPLIWAVLIWALIETVHYVTISGVSLW